MQDHDEVEMYIRSGKRYIEPKQQSEISDGGAGDDGLAGV